MTRGRVDGLIVMSPDIDVHSLRDNLPRTLPVVLLNGCVAAGAFDSIGIDNFGGAYRMVGHLLSHRHREVAMIMGPERNYDAAERLRGYRRALQDGGAAPGPSLEAPGDFTEASGYDAVQGFLKRRQRPTAIFAANDATAIGALSALQEAGIGVPEEIALAGFDDIPIARFVRPSLSTVCVNIHELGMLATDLLLHAIEERNEHVKKQIQLSTTIVTRDSCGSHS
jgi:LacI family transcriptional regulator